MGDDVIGPHIGRPELLSSPMMEREMKARRIVRTSMLMLTGTAMLVVAPAVLAQETDAGPEVPAIQDGDAIEAGEILVTARRRSERLQDVPVAISSVNQETINNYGLNDVAAVATMTPQLKVSVGGPSGGAQLYLRGIGSTANTGFDPAVGLVIDGVFYNRTLWLTQAFIDMQSVEVLKGPQSLYYGKNTPAGLVMITTAGPTPYLEVGGKAGYEIESREKFGEAYISGPISDTLGARLVARVSEMDGWIKTVGETRQSGDAQNLTLPAPSNKRLPGTEYQTGRLTLQWDPSNSFMVTAKAAYTHYRDAGPDALIQIFSCQGPGGTPQTTFGVSSLDDCRANGSVGRQDFPQEFVEGSDRFTHGSKPFSDYNSVALSLNATYDFGWGNINSITGWNRYELNAVGDTSYAGTGSYLVTDDTTNRSFTQELRLLTEFGGPLNFLVGGFYADTLLDSTIAARIAPHGPDPVTGNWLSLIGPSHQTGETWSAFGEVTWNITPELEFAGGARYTEETKDTWKTNSFVNAALAAALTAPVFSAKTKSDDVSPQATLTFRPTRDLTFYGAYKEGFKAGGFSISSILTAATKLDQLVFGPERASGFEAGVKASVLDRSMFLTLNFYDYDYKDLQVTAFDPATTSFRITNAAKARVKGVEANMNWRVSDVFELRSDVAYNHARFADYLGQCYSGQTVQMGCNQLLNANSGVFTSQDLSGKRPPLAPDWNFNLGGTFRKEDAFGSVGLQVTMDGHYVSRYPIDADNRPDTFQEGYVTVDASLRVFGQDDRWSLAVIGRNLTNEAILLTGAGRPGTGGPSGLDENNPAAGRLADGRGTVDRLRSITLQAAFKF